MSRQAQNIPQNYAEVREQLSDIDWHMQCMISMEQEAGQGQEQQPEQAPGLARIMKNISILQIKSFRQGWVSQGKTRQGRTGPDQKQALCQAVLTLVKNHEHCQGVLPSLPPAPSCCCAHTWEQLVFAASRAYFNLRRQRTEASTYLGSCRKVGKACARVAARVATLFIFS